MLADQRFDRFRKRFQASRKLLERQKHVLSQGHISKTELERVAEMCFFNIFVDFEGSLVELFVDNLMMRHGSDGKRRSLVVPSSRGQAVKLLAGRRPYPDILPIDHTIEVACDLLKDGRPFSLLSNDDKEKVRRAQAIRNHIAHQSTHSRDKYRRKITNNVALPRRRYQPGYYLNSMITARATYFDHHASDVAGVLRFLCDET